MGGAGAVNSPNKNCLQSLWTIFYTYYFIVTHLQIIMKKAVK